MVAQSTDNRKRLKRQYLRAPLRREILFEDEGHIFKAFCANISEGGMLLSLMPNLPKINALCLMIDLPMFPDFAALSTERLTKIKSEMVERKIYRIRGRIVRSFEGKSEIDVIMSTNIGLEFVNLPADVVLALRTFVSQYARNIIFLLNLFESHRGNKEDQATLLRNLCRLLGYGQDSKISLLRQKILHDYQSLESL
ncbi:MAG: PilZ domain-containing protein [Bdellovibrio sp.]|nr:PilZ domain-containing protein [Bdellovibrio sp.]